MDSDRPGIGRYFSSLGGIFGTVHQRILPKMPAYNNERFV